MSTIKITPVNDDKSYKAALSRIEDLWEADNHTPQGEELNVLMIMVEAYEDIRYPMDDPDPVSAIEFIMDQKGYSLEDLRKLIGIARASELMNKKRPVSITQAKLLYKEWGVPAEALLSQ